MPLDLSAAFDTTDHGTLLDLVFAVYFSTGSSPIFYYSQFVKISSILSNAEKLLFGKP